MRSDVLSPDVDPVVPEPGRRVLRPLPLCPQHVEKLDLGAFVRITDDAPLGSSRDSGTFFSLVLRNQEIKFKVGPLEGS